MRLSGSITALCFGVATSVVVAAGVARATDYFGMSLRGAEFAPEPLGPATGFQPPAAPAPSLSRAPQADARQTAPSPARRLQLTQLRRATRPNPNPSTGHRFLSPATPCRP